MMMVSQSHASRAPRAAGGQFAKQPSVASNAEAVVSSSPTPRHHLQNDLHHHANGTSASEPHAIDESEPPVKKRRLMSVRQRHTTSDISTSAQSANETLLHAAQPRGQLREAFNGVERGLGVAQDAFTRSNVAANSTSSLSQSITLAAPPPAKQEEKRSLRSHDDGPRLKSELATYFPNFEDIIFDVRGEPEFITTETVLYVTDDGPKPSSSTPSSPQGTRGVVNGATRPLDATQYNGYTQIDIEAVARTLPDDDADPLDDAYYVKAHRRAERREKQLRNIEKERAMHEKVQLERLLDGLLSHDWLKVLGITGVTDGEARKFESKRDYFIAEVRALVDKFKQWREQEKRQKMEKEAAAARDAETETEEGSVEPPSSEMNASAARQLQQETLLAAKSGFKIRLGKRSNPSTPVPTSQPSRAPPVYAPPEPITSFYAKRHLRDAALGKARHGRNVTAFGCPIPEMPMTEFQLPADYVTEDALRVRARERRRRKRASVVDATTT